MNTKLIAAALGLASLAQWGCGGGGAPSRSRAADLIKEAGAQKGERPLFLLLVDVDAALAANLIVRKETSYERTYLAAVDGSVLAASSLLGPNPERAALALGMASRLDSVEGPKEDGRMRVACQAESVGVDVTGLRLEPDKTRVAVEFDWTPTPPATVRDCGCAVLKTPHNPGQAVLAKYDDGWRVLEVDWHPED